MNVAATKPVKSPQAPPPKAIRREFLVNPLDNKKDKLSTYTSEVLELSPAGIIFTATS